MKVGLVGRAFLLASVTWLAIVVAPSVAAAVTSDLQTTIKIRSRTAKTASLRITLTNAGPDAASAHATPGAPGSFRMGYGWYGVTILSQSQTCHDDPYNARNRSCASVGDYLPRGAKRHLDLTVRIDKSGANLTGDFESDNWDYNTD